MDRGYYLSLAAGGLRMPIGADLVLNEERDPEEARRDPQRLAAVVARTARVFHTPLAFPLMDLTLDKADLLAAFGISEEQADAFHFDNPPSLSEVSRVLSAGTRDFPPRSLACQGALQHVAAHEDLLPIGMMIGPFSLMTKLIADPIAGVALAGMGATAQEELSVALVERCLALAEVTVLRSAKAQIEAGARAMLVCEPAANTVFLSPRQLRAGSDIFSRFVLGPNRRVADLLHAHGVDLIFHDCGELTTDMVRAFAQELHPAILSLGSSRKLWEDAAVVPKDTVLFGNLPTKTFYSDAAMPVEEVERRTRETLARMAECGHPHILGSECDVLHVPGSAETIRRKVDAMLRCAAEASSSSAR